MQQHDCTGTIFIISPHGSNEMGVLDTVPQLWTRTKILCKGTCISKCELLYRVTLSHSSFYPSSLPPHTAHESQLENKCTCFSEVHIIERTLMEPWAQPLSLFRHWKEECLNKRGKFKLAQYIHIYEHMLYVSILEAR